MVHTPWIPESVGATTASLTELVDVFPTVAKLAGLPVPPGVDGKDISALQSNPKVRYPLSSMSQLLGGVLGCGSNEPPGKMLALPLRLPTALYHMSDFSPANSIGPWMIPLDCTRVQLDLRTPFFAHPLHLACPIPRLHP